MELKRFLVVVPPKGSVRDLSSEQIQDLVRKRLGVEELSTVRSAVNSLRHVSPQQVPWALASKEANVELAMSLLEQLARSFVGAPLEFADERTEVVVAGDDRLRGLDFHGLESPEMGVVYARHPYAPSALFRFSEFHSQLVKEKRKEFEVLVGALGGSAIRIVETDTAGKEGFVGARVEDANFQAGVGARSATDAAFDLTCTFEPSNRQPHVPEGLRWLKSEPDWQAMVTNRVHDVSLRMRDVTFNYESDFSVNIGAKLRFEGVGLDVGGSFESVKKISRRCRVEFYSKAGPT